MIFLSCYDKQNKINIRIEPGLSIDLFLCEPLVIDPVAYAFDESGRLYVVEDRGYPDPAEGGTPVVREGRIALLEDRDSDGKYDFRSEFVTDLTYPNGILPWRGGVFVTCAPDVFYFKDSTGDGVADIRQVALTGFHDTKTAQIRTSHPTLGLDGWVYLTSGLNGGDVYSPLHSDRPPVSFSASDGRFHPDTYEFETVGGKSQFGLTFDAWGNRFGVSNRNPIMQVVMEPEYLNRNPWLSKSESVKNVSKVAGEAVVFPLRKVVTTSDYIPTLMGQSHQGTFTAASSTYIYYGQGLNPEHQGNAFICESAQNLVQRQILAKEGPAYRATLPYRDREFVASEDEWFRPVFVNNGPDDGLYVVDMHRKVIDHPSYIPEELRDQIDFNSGKDLGRIYRITREHYPIALARKKWFTGEEETTELLERLDGELEWESQTAFRLLLQRENVNASDLKALFGHSTSPRHRVRALWLMQNKGILDEETLLEAMQDPEPGVRLQAIRLLPLQSMSTKLRDAMNRTSSDSDMHVRLASALGLGSMRGDQVLKSLADLAIRDGKDYWMRQAILSGVGERMLPFFQALVKHPQFHKSDLSEFMLEMGQMFGNGASVADCQHLAKEMAQQNEIAVSMKFGTWQGVIQGLKGRKDIAQNTNLFQRLLQALSNAEQESFVDELMQGTIPGTENQNDRVLAIRLLGLTDMPQSLLSLRGVLGSEEPLAIRKAGVEAIMANGSEESGEILVDSDIWQGFTPAVRSQVISSMVSEESLVSVLLHAIRQGAVKASDIPSMTRKRLMTSGSVSRQNLAKEVFGHLEEGDRMAVYQDFRSRLDQPGNAEKGRIVFERLCSVCHAYEGTGGKVGPDLTSLTNQPAEAILLHTLLPNYEIYPAYQTITLELADGRHLAGWVVSETINVLTIRTAGGIDETILRSNIKSLQNTGQSLMPEGLEHSMNDGDMNNLIAFLKKGSNYVN